MNVAAEALGEAAVERVLADVAERRMAEIVPEPDRLDEVLVEPQRASDGARDLGDLERVRQPRPVVIAGRRHEHLGLVLEAPERLGVNDPVAVALERRPQPAIGLGTLPASRIGAGGQGREIARLAGALTLARTRPRRRHRGDARRRRAGLRASARSRVRF